jgi:hypothetical protein
MKITHQRPTLSPASQSPACSRTTDISSQNKEGYLELKLAYKTIYVKSRTNSKSPNKSTPRRNRNNKPLTSIASIIFLTRTVSATAERLGRDVVELIVAAGRKKEKTKVSVHPEQRGEKKGKREWGNGAM